MLFVNLTSILGTTIILMLFCKHYGQHASLALLYPFSISPVVSAMLCTTEPVYIFFLSAGFYFYAVKDKILSGGHLFHSLHAFQEEVALGSVGILLLHDIRPERI